MSLPPEVFCDTSFFYACFDPKDVNHLRVQALVAEAASSATGFCSTWHIISETVTLLRYRCSFRATLGFLDEVKPALWSARYGDRVRIEAEHIFRQYGRDHRLSFCDAVSFVCGHDTPGRHALFGFRQRLSRAGSHSADLTLRGSPVPRVSKDSYRRT